MLIMMMTMLIWHREQRDNNIDNNIFIFTHFSFLEHRNFMHLLTKRLQFLGNFVAQAQTSYRASLLDPTGGTDFCPPAPLTIAPPKFLVSQHRHTYTSSSIAYTHTVISITQTVYHMIENSPATTTNNLNDVWELLESLSQRQQVEQ